LILPRNVTFEFLYINFSFLRNISFGELSVLNSGISADFKIRLFTGRKPTGYFLKKSGIRFSIGVVVFKNISTESRQ